VSLASIFPPLETLNKAYGVEWWPRFGRPRPPIKKGGRMKVSSHCKFAVINSGDTPLSTNFVILSVCFVDWKRLAK